MASPEERPQTYGSGRVCAVEGCSTVLSRYNPSPICCLHSHGWASRRTPLARNRSRLPELVGTCQNPRCGAEFATTNPAKRYCCDRCRMQNFQRRATAERRAAAV